MSKNKDDFFIKVMLNPEQARLVVTALDVFSRIHIGQFNIVQEQFWGKIDRSDELAHLLLMARQICFPELEPNMGHSHGISGCPTEAGKISWDVQQVIRQAEAYARMPEGGITVNFNDPMFVSNSTPRPTAKAQTILDRLADV